MSDDISGDRLRAFIERVERLNEEKSALGEDIKEIYAEVKGNGYDPKILKMIIKIRRMDPDKRVEEETILDLYMTALKAN